MMDRKKKEVQDMLRKNRNPYEIAQQLNLKVREVRQVMLQHELEDLPGWGRLGLQIHIISRRRASAPEWPSGDIPRLLEHRRQHDQGRVNMCQGRDGDWIIQYAIPNRKPVRRSPWFYGGC